MLTLTHHQGMNRDKVERVKKYVFAAFVALIVLFYVSLHKRIERTKSEIFLKLTVFDNPISDFPLQFMRIRSYINRIADHYGCPSSEDIKGLRSELKEFNEIVGGYCRERTDDNFRKISGLIEKITMTPSEGKGEVDKKRPNALTHMVKLHAHPLTLSVFLLAPISCTHVIPAQAALSKYSHTKDDQLLLYLFTLRQPNIFRSFFNFFIWTRNYDNNVNFGEFGNLFSYEKKEMSVTSRLKELLSEFRSEKENIEEIFSSYLITAPQKFSLTVSIENIIRNSAQTNSPIIVVKTWPSSIKLFTQVSEIFDQLYLKAMLIEKESKTFILVFDKTFQVWTIFSEDGRVLSMPRQIARLYYTRYGKYLIYGE